MGNGKPGKPVGGEMVKWHNGKIGTGAKIAKWDKGGKGEKQNGKTGRGGTVVKTVKPVGE